MKKINIFLASSNELKAEREKFEQEIYRKTKAWYERQIFLHLDIWEDLSARFGSEGMQHAYNEFVRKADIFVLLAWTKVGMYTDEEFEQAFGQFQSTRKPFIFTYFKSPDGQRTDPSLDVFKQKLLNLKHFGAVFKNEDDLWNQFNKELERLFEAKFEEFRRDGQPSGISIQDSKNVVIGPISAGGNVHIGDSTIIHNEGAQIKNQFNNGTFNNTTFS